MVLVKYIINFFVYRICFFLIHKPGKIEDGKLGYDFTLPLDYSTQLIPLAHDTGWDWVEKVDSSGNIHHILMLAECSTMLSV